MSITNLTDIFNDDELSILTADPVKESTNKSDDQRLVDSFVEINNFYDLKKQIPTNETNDIHEHKLYSRLQIILSDQNKINILKKYDTNNLLPMKIFINDSDYSSILDISNDELDIFKFQNVSKIKAETDFVAVRKPCKDFASFENIFKECHQKLQSGELKFEKFTEKHIQESGGFFVVNGIIAYLEKTIGIKKDSNSKADGRTRIIFENGTESSMKLRSFGKALFANGKSIIKNDQEAVLGNVLRGYIYILKSLSKDPQISSIQNLYKIGYSNGDVDDRIKNANKDYTYLNAEIHKVAVCPIYDINPQKLEDMLHRIFSDVRLNITIDDGKGNKVLPQEWFIVPFNVIEEAISLIPSGNIVNYHYNKDLEKLILK
jgi:Meiotically up-regulated gene 113